MQWMTLFKKELLEMWRNYKLIWVPLVIILLSLIDPITTYYMPILIDTIGGLPDGAIFDIPTPEASEVMMMSLGQLSSLGVLVIVLISMGTIAGEYKSGVAELILVRPISATNYITSKWFSYVALVIISVGAGLLLSWYYITILFGELRLISFVQTWLFYSLWLIFVISIIIFYNTLVKTPGFVAGLSLISIMGLSVITSAFGRYLTWSPTNLSGYIYDMLVSNTISSDLIITSLITVLLIFLTLISAIVTFSKKRLFA